MESKQTKQKQTHRYRKHFDGFQMGGALRGWMKKVKVLRSTNWLLQNNHGDVKYSIGNIVNIILITVYGYIWCQMHTRFIEVITLCVI